MIQALILLACVCLSYGGALGDIVDRDRRVLTDEEDRYFIILNESVTDVDAKSEALIKGHFQDAVVLDIFDDEGFKGFSCLLPEHALEEIRKDEDVLHVERDHIIELEDQDEVFIPSRKLETTAQNVTETEWGLDRLDQETLPLDGMYNYSYTGAGVDVYVIGQGIWQSHIDFGGRVTCGWNFKRFRSCFERQGTTTFRSGLIGGEYFGVAKKVNLINIKVAGGIIAFSMNMLRGVNAAVRIKKSRPGIPAVLYSPYASNGLENLLEKAHYDAMDAGMITIVGAGGTSTGGTDACTIYPARMERAIRVSGMDVTDNKLRGSNTGKCVDLFAPGEGMLSCFIGWDDAVADCGSSTTYSAALAAGVAALYLERDPSMTHDEVKAAMIADATVGVLEATIGADSPNRLLSVRALLL